jgi:N-acetylmuramoyl-L-alanine amidase
MSKLMQYQVRLKIYGICLIALLTLLSAPAFAQLAKITQINITNAPALTRFSFDITGGPFRYQWKFSSQTNQLNLNFENTSLATALPKTGLSATPVQNYQLKTAIPLQLTFQLKRAVTVKVYAQPIADDKNKTRLILELKAKGSETNAKSPTKPLPPSIKTTAKVVVTSAKPPSPPQPLMPVAPVENRVEPKVKLTDKTSARPIMVVIDPGHGGKDSGAVGPNNVREKDVVLAISKLLQKTFKQQAGFDAELTRYRDIFIPLRQRLAIARKCKADIFIAIHADAAYRNQEAVGASVFALSERGATSEGARWLAQNENESELIHGVIVDKDQLLRSVLLDLSQTHTIAVSLEMGQSILAKLSVFSKLHYRRVEQAAFVVLKSPDIPSLLVETGYISNPIQEKNLQDPKYQQQIANAIVQGVIAYFIQHPPGNRLITS